MFVGHNMLSNVYLDIAYDMIYASVCPRFPKLDQQTVKLIRNSPFIPNELYPLGEQLNTTCAPGYRKTTQDYVIVTCIEQDGVMKWDGKGIETCFDIGKLS